MEPNRASESTSSKSNAAHDAAEQCIAEVIRRYGPGMRASGVSKQEVRQRCTKLAVAASMQRAAELQSVALVLLGQVESCDDPILLHAMLDQLLKKRRG